VLVQVDILVCKIGVDAGSTPARFRRREKFLENLSGAGFNRTVLSTSRLQSYGARQM
jgi:hypothetical protein